ncbi:MAG TPA: rhodanese-like domain-containing protein, partial [Plasticicumulans sp.]|nr:rhodanese-like domain-containing protein [Plasticicumulans sp.]
AINLDWSTAFDPGRRPRTKPIEHLRAALLAAGVDPAREIVVYCQTHHRSAHTWVVLKALGYPRVRGYAGAWSEWGNTPGLPIEP